MIRSIQWNNHQILGNLSLDFVNPATGKPYNTVILAGDNGTGKTSILESIVDFFNGGTFEPFEAIEYEMDGIIYRMTRPVEDPGSIVYGCYDRTNISQSGGASEIVRHGGDWSAVKGDKKDVRTNGFAYSKARSGFVLQPIRQTSGLVLDSATRENDNQEDFTSIKQLLVDIDGQDNADLAKGLRNKTIHTIEEHDATSRISRFKKAFEGFFDDIRFDKIADENNQKNILFSNRGKTVDIDKLSTGEKQIVFRGSLLLRNEGNLRGSVVLIDEPELSLHPKWQKKILPFYRGLFTADNSQMAQLFFATHSEHVIESAFEDLSNVLVLILQRTNTGIVSSRKITTPFALPVPTMAETNYLAFGVPSVDYHIELYSALMNLEGATEIKAFDDLLLSQPEFAPANRQKEYVHSHQTGNPTTYRALSTYIRNCIDHPDASHSYSEVELTESIEAMAALLRRLRQIG